MRKFMMIADGVFALFWFGVAIAAICGVSIPPITAICGCSLAGLYNLREMLDR